MVTPLDLERLAVRVETLSQVHTHGWHPADDLDFHRRMPGGRDPRALPTSADLREKAASLRALKELPDLYEMYRVWILTAMTLEDLQRDNDPRNPKRVMRDMATGRARGFAFFKSNISCARSSMEYMSWCGGGEIRVTPGVE